MNLWAYLNPYSLNTVEKASTYDFLLLCMFNIGHKSLKEVSLLVAQYLIEYYNELGINVKERTVTFK